MKTLKEIHASASKDSLLGALSLDQVEEIFAVTHRKTYRKGETLFSQGDVGDSAALILSGAVKISTFSSGGREIVFAYLSAGEMVGDIAVLDGTERAASATAAEKVECLIISRPDLLRKIDEEPELARAIIRFLCTRLRSTNSLLESDRSYEQAARLARGILRLWNEHGHKGEQDGSLGVTISQSDLGAFVRMARENVSRQISDWTRAGILTAKQGQITILDKDALEDIGDVFE